MLHRPWAFGKTREGTYSQKSGWKSLEMKLEVAGNLIRFPCLSGTMGPQAPAHCGARPGSIEFCLGAAAWPHIILDPRAPPELRCAGHSRFTPTLTTRCRCRSQLERPGLDQLPVAQAESLGGPSNLFSASPLATSSLRTADLGAPAVLCQLPTPTPHHLF